MDKQTDLETAAACNSNDNNSGNLDNNGGNNSGGHGNNGSESETTSNSKIQYLFHRLGDNRNNGPSNCGNHRNNGPNNSTWYTDFPVTDLDADNNDDEIEHDDEYEISNNSAENENGDNNDNTQNTSIQELFNKLSGNNDSNTNVASSNKPPRPKGPMTGTGDVTSGNESIREMFNKLCNNEGGHNSNVARKGRKISDTVNYRGVGTSGTSGTPGASGYNTEDSSSIQYLFNKIADSKETAGGGSSRPSSRAGNDTYRKASEGSNIQHLFNREASNNQSYASGNNSNNSGSHGNMYSMFTSRAELMLKHPEDQGKYVLMGADICR